MRFVDKSGKVFSIRKEKRLLYFNNVVGDYFIANKPYDAYFFKEKDSGKEWIYLVESDFYVNTSLKKARKFDLYEIKGYFVENFNGINEIKNIEISNLITQEKVSANHIKVSYAALVAYHQARTICTGSAISFNEFLEECNCLMVYNIQENQVYDIYNKLVKILPKDFFNYMTDALQRYIYDNLVRDTHEVYFHIGGKVDLGAVSVGKELLNKDVFINISEADDTFADLEVQDSSIAANNLFTYIDSNTDFEALSYRVYREFLDASQLNINLYVGTNVVFEFRSIENFYELPKQIRNMFIKRKNYIKVRFGDGDVMTFDKAFMGV